PAALCARAAPRTPLAARRTAGGREPPTDGETTWKEAPGRRAVPGAVKHPRPGPGRRRVPRGTRARAGRGPGRGPAGGGAGTAGPAPPPPCTGPSRAGPEPRENDEHPQ